jgi:la-related protein 1
MVSAATYCFWSNSLRTKFDRDIYNWFCYDAQKDARNGSLYGMQCLFRFYSYGLETTFRADIFQDFQKYVVMDCEAGHTYGIEKMWSFLHYSKIKPEVTPTVRMYIVEWLV